MPAMAATPMPPWWSAWMAAILITTRSRRSHFQRQLEQAAYRAGGGGYLAPAKRSALSGGRGKLSWGRCAYLPPRRDPLRPCSLLPGELAADLRDGITAFGRKLRAYQAPDAVLTGLETRTSSPVRLLRGDNFQCTGLTGLYPCGEGAGYAGGIMTARRGRCALRRCPDAAVRPG